MNADAPASLKTLPRQWVILSDSEESQPFERLRSFAIAQDDRMREGGFQQSKMNADASACRSSAFICVHL
jgi:hypothetical protein